MDFKLPNLGEGVTSGLVVKVTVAPGDTVRKGQTLFEIETDKAVAEVPSDQDGVISAVLIKTGEKAKPGQVVLRFEGGQNSATPTPQTTPKPESKPATPSAPTPAAKPDSVINTQNTAPAKPFDARTSASPSVRRYAREHGIDLAGVTAHSPDGRITISDLTAPTPTHTTSPASAHTLPDLPDFSVFGEVTVEELTGIREKTAENMALAWSQVPQVTQFDTADVTNLEVLRQKYAKVAESKGVKLTMTVILMKIVAAALRAFPQVNTSIDMKNRKVIQKHFCHIGVAVDTDRGLLVPVIRDADKKNILTLAAEINTAAEKARTRKLTRDEMQGASFTITNLGSIGGSHFTPIVNWPQAAILGVGRSSTTAVWQNDQWVPRVLLPLSLSYDHRLIDGADAARFLRWIANAAQEPFLLELEG